MIRRSSSSGKKGGRGGAAAGSTGGAVSTRGGTRGAGKAAAAAAETKSKASKAKREREQEKDQTLAAGDSGDVQEEATVAEEKQSKTLTRKGRSKRCSRRESTASGKGSTNGDSESGSTSRRGSSTLLESVVDDVGDGVTNTNTTTTTNITNSNKSSKSKKRGAPSVAAATIEAAPSFKRARTTVRNYAPSRALQMDSNDPYLQRLGLTVHDDSNGSRKKTNLKAEYKGRPVAVQSLLGVTAPGKEATAAARAEEQHMRRRQRAVAKLDAQLLCHTECVFFQGNEFVSKIDSDQIDTITSMRDAARARNDLRLASNSYGKEKSYSDPKAYQPTPLTVRQPRGTLPVLPDPPSSLFDWPDRRIEAAYLHKKYAQDPDHNARDREAAAEAAMAVYARGGPYSGKAIPHGVNVGNGNADNNHGQVAAATNAAASSYFENETIVGSPMLVRLLVEEAIAIARGGLNVFDRPETWQKFDKAHACELSGVTSISDGFHQGVPSHIARRYSIQDASLGDGQDDDDNINKALSAPQRLVVSYDREWISVPPYVLSQWEYALLEPVTDFRAYCDYNVLSVNNVRAGLDPLDDEIGKPAVPNHFGNYYLKELSAIFDVCNFGTLVRKEKQTAGLLLDSLLERDTDAIVALLKDLLRNCSTRTSASAALRAANGGDLEVALGGTLNTGAATSVMDGLDPSGTRIRSNDTNASTTNNMIKHENTIGLRGGGGGPRAGGRASSAADGGEEIMHDESGAKIRDTIVVFVMMPPSTRCYALLVMDALARASKRLEVEVFHAPGSSAALRDQHADAAAPGTIAGSGAPTAASAATPHSPIASGRSPRSPTFNPVTPPPKGPPLIPRSAASNSSSMSLSSAVQASALLSTPRNVVGSARKDFFLQRRTSLSVELANTAATAAAAAAAAAEQEAASARNLIFQLVPADAPQQLLRRQSLQMLSYSIFAKSAASRNKFKEPIATGDNSNPLCLHVTYAMSPAPCSDEPSAWLVVSWTDNKGKLLDAVAVRNTCGFALSSSLPKRPNKNDDDDDDDVNGESAEMVKSFLSAMVWERTISHAQACSDPPCKSICVSIMHDPSPVERAFWRSTFESHRMEQFNAGVQTGGFTPVHSPASRPTLKTAESSQSAAAPLPPQYRFDHLELARIRVGYVSADKVKESTTELDVVTTGQNSKLIIGTSSLGDASKLPLVEIERLEGNRPFDLLVQDLQLLGVVQLLSSMSIVPIHCNVCARLALWLAQVS